LIRGALAILLLVPATGCGRSVATDGSPDAQRVAQWLSSRSWQADDSIIMPKAPLVMSDYSVPLNRTSLETLGPARVAGCKLDSVRRSGAEVVASWGCAEAVPEIRRQVRFRLENGRVRYASYSEADMTQIAP